MRGTPGTCCVSLLLSVALPAQCWDPPAPRRGFAVQIDTDQPITYTDSYRTRADAAYPTDAPGPCGWPLLVEIHGFGGSKANIGIRTLASQGFFAVAYDVRGQGSAIALNPGRGFPGYTVDTWTDLAEIIEWAIATYPGRVDAGRVGVTGFSQGAVHSWAAAAYSGRALPSNPRRSTPFPVIHAAVPRAHRPNRQVPPMFAGTMFSNGTGKSLYVPQPNFVIDPSLNAVIAQYLDNDDPLGLSQWSRAQPGFIFWNELSQTTVPVLASVSWLDEFVVAKAAAEAIAAMPAATPRRLVISTGHHKTPKNAYLRSVARGLRSAWLHRFLKGRAEPTEAGPRALIAALPADSVTYLAPSSRWRLRADAAFPPANTTTLTYYLRAAGALSTQPPRTPERADRIQHRVPPGYGVREWHLDGSGSDPGSVATILGKIPLSEVTYSTTGLGQDTEITGLPVVQLHVTPSAPDFAVGVRLEVVDPGGNAQLVSHAFGAARGQPGGTLLDIEMQVSDCVVPAGWRLRLRVRNHYLIQPSTDEIFTAMPIFRDYDVDVEHGPSTPSSLDLPVRPVVRLDAMETATELSIRKPGRVDIRLQSSAAWQGLGYALLASTTGQGPPVVLPGSEPLYLVPDLATQAFLAASGSALLPGFVGVLNPAGSAQASLDLSTLAPLPPSLAGSRWHFAPVALNGPRLETGAPFVLELR